MWPMLDTMALRTYAPTDADRNAGPECVVGPAAEKCDSQAVLRLFSGFLVGTPRRIGQTRISGDVASVNDHLRCEMGTRLLSSRQNTRSSERRHSRAVHHRHPCAAACVFARADRGVASPNRSVHTAP